MSPLFTHLLIPFFVAMFLAVNMGGSGTAPSFAAAYGANIIRRFSIPGLFGICVFAGALIAGKKVGNGFMPTPFADAQGHNGKGVELHQGSRAIHKIWLVWLIAPAFSFGMSYFLLAAANRFDML